MSVEAAAWHETWLRERPRDYGDDVLLRIAAGLLVRAVEYLRAQQLRTLLQADFARAFEHVDVVRRADDAAGRAGHRPDLRSERVVRPLAAQHRQSG